MWCRGPILVRVEFLIAVGLESCSSFLSQVSLSGFESVDKSPPRK